MMLAIFGFSSIPSSEMPNFGSSDLVVKKGGHVLGYGLLAVAYWAGLRFDKRRWWLALLFALIYAASDEYHQAFVPGRHPSWVDALVIDGSGAASCAWFVLLDKAEKSGHKKNRMTQTASVIR